MRTGQLHSLHPNLHGVKEQLDQQRASAEQQLHERIARLRHYGLGVRQASAQQQARIYEQLYAVREATSQQQATQRRR